ncbi:MAG TPA: hypothetical protein VJ695_11595 [Nitrososphaera sp.]|jgi:hypothetical protein|nr:hypothetical protein [Nitrososphaera sp.]
MERRRRAKLFKSYPINKKYRTTNHMAVTSGSAKRIVDDVLSIYDVVLGISIMNMKGNILAANSKEAFREVFRVTQDRATDSGALALATLNVVNETRNIFGRVEAIITIHQNCKLMLLPLPPFQLLVGLVLERSVNVEDKIAKEIEKLVADTLAKHSRL